MATTALNRFHNAQNSAHAGFAAALSELRTMGKRGHWIWYVFPQLAGLGASSQSKEYGIRGAGEAIEYLRDPVLRSRLVQVTHAVEQRLQAGARLQDVMGSHIDSLKLISSLTLFVIVGRRLAAEEALPEYAELVATAEQVLAAAELEGFPRCARTRRELEI